MSSRHADTCIPLLVIIFSQERDKSGVLKLNRSYLLELLPVTISLFRHTYPYGSARDYHTISMPVARARICLGRQKGGGKSRRRQRER